MPEDFGSDPGNFTEVNGRLFFTADSPEGQSEPTRIWQSDGTPGTAFLAAEIDTTSEDPSRPNPRYLTNVNGTLYFTAYHDNFGRELWAAPIRPEGPHIELSLSETSVSETGRPKVTVSAVASEAVTGDQSLTLTVSGTDVTVGDYSLTDDDPSTDGIQITIPDGSTTGSVTFTVTEDADPEATETAILTLSDPPDGFELFLEQQSLTIRDNDSATAEVLDLAPGRNRSEPKVSTSARNSRPPRCFKLGPLP